MKRRGRTILDHECTIDLIRIRAQAEEAVGRLASANEATRTLSEELAPYIGQYCSGLAAAPYPVQRFCGHAN